LLEEVLDVSFLVSGLSTLLEGGPGVGWPPYFLARVFPQRFFFFGRSEPVRMLLQFRLPIPTGLLPSLLSLFLAYRPSGKNVFRPCFLDTFTSSVLGFEIQALTEVSRVRPFLVFSRPI